jgi:hypothetical protein
VSNFEKKLHRSSLFVPLPSADVAEYNRGHFEGRAEPTYFRVYPHPLAKIDPLIWTWPAERVLKVFQSMGL